MSQDLEYEAGVSSGALTYPVPGGSVRKNGHMMIKGFPCKVTDISVSKTGKHGHAKAHVFGNDVFTGKKYEDVFPTSHNVEAPVITKSEVEVVAIDDGTLEYMDDEGEIHEISMPTDEDLAKDLTAAVDADDKDISVTILRAMEKEQIISFRESKG